MNKNVFGRKFKRNANQRKSLFKSLIFSLITKESIKTTLQKAKAIKGDVDKLVNKAKQEEKIARHLLEPHLLSLDAIDKMIKKIAPRFKDRNSGYTRIIRTGRRFSDRAEMALMEWVVKREIKDEKSEMRDVKELPAGKTEEKRDGKKKEIKK